MDMQRRTTTSTPRIQSSQQCSSWRIPNSLFLCIYPVKRRHHKVNEVLLFLFLFLHYPIPVFLLVNGTTVYSLLKPKTQSSSLIVIFVSYLWTIAFCIMFQSHFLSLCLLSANLVFVTNLFYFCLVLK